jgi:glycosyltransferase involved in cell wall biosynthesis
MPPTPSPLITIIMPTYNRAHTFERAVGSVLKQSYSNIELIIIDDGSTDHTLKILDQFIDSRIKVVRHEINKGVTAAKNTGLKEITGEWFTYLDSDDEMVPEAIEKMMEIPLSLDPTISAVTCNCWDTTTNSFSGKGLNKSQYLGINELMTICKGEFWGITKTSLLKQDTFNERIAGFENILWYKINERGNRFYIHEALRVYHTEGSDRILKSQYNLKKQINLYTNLVDESFYLSQTKKYRPEEYARLCKNGLIVLRASNHYSLAAKYYELLESSDRRFIHQLIYKSRLISLIYVNYSLLKSRIKPYINRILNH